MQKRTRTSTPNISFVDVYDFMTSRHGCKVVRIQPEKQPHRVAPPCHLSEDVCFLSPRATLQISRQNDMRIFRYQVCSKEITEGKTAAALLGRVGGMAGGTAQFQSADGSSIGFFMWSGPS